MDSRRSERAFAYLIAVQALHSLEEYFHRLWESFPPAQFLSGMISSDLELGFRVINASVVALGVLCYVGPIRGRWEAAGLVAWTWVGLELANGIGHLAWSISQGRYTPGLITSLLLLLVATWLGTALVMKQQSAT